MTGGLLDANFQSGDLRAWFDLKIRAAMPELVANGRSPVTRYPVGGTERHCGIETASHAREAI